MINTGRKVFANLALIALTGTALTACSAVDRVKNIGKFLRNPPFKIRCKPTVYKPISMPMPGIKRNCSKGILYGREASKVSLKTSAPKLLAIS